MFAAWMCLKVCACVCRLHLVGADMSQADLQAVGLYGN